MQDQRLESAEMHVLGAAGGKYSIIYILVGIDNLDYVLVACRDPGGIVQSQGEIFFLQGRIAKEYERLVGCSVVVRETVDLFVLRLSPMK